MIISVVVDLKQIFKEQKKYPWSRPDKCCRCLSYRLWGHGFVLVYFDEFLSGLYIKRYRCQDCNCVIRLRPKGYFPRFQASIQTIRNCLSHKISMNRYSPEPSHRRQRHWFKALHRNTFVHFGNQWQTRLMEAFDRLCNMGRIPVSCSI